MSLKAQDVFVPNAYPQHTYIERKDQGLEKELSDSLITPGQVISLSGPSKSGKTVLVEKVVGRDNLITISGTSIKHPDDLWSRVLDWMNIPETIAETETVTKKTGAKVAMGGSGSVPLVAKAHGTAEGSRESGKEKSTETHRQRGGLLQVVKEIANSDFALLIDDFHYMDPKVQIEVAKSLKDAVRQGIKIITAMVRHRGDDVVRANPELRGRVKAIDLDYWKDADLQKIAIAGFDALNVAFPTGTIGSFVTESAGSPQLMQLLCLQACFVLDLRQKTLLKKTASVDGPTQQKIFEQTSSNTDFRSLVDVIDVGPKSRGAERKTYNFKDRTKGDVYRAVLKAVADNPPRLSFPYQELLNRTIKVCIMGDSPAGSSVITTCHHMSKLAREKFPNERAIEWDEQKQVFDIPDPYLLFYLRWSDRLKAED